MHIIILVKKRGVLMAVKNIHLVGIGGISMSGIAEILLQKGYRVSGSDLKDSHLLEKLHALGARISIGHQANNVEGADLVIFSNAISKDNPELLFAVRKGIPVLKRAEMIARLMQDKKGIAVSGTHGKTTTTAMIATILKKGGLDPTILVGGELDLIKGNAYLGQGEYLITEADESDGSFLYYDPQIVVVTNVEIDHHDYYDSKEKLVKTFKQFIEKTPVDGRAVLYAGDPVLMDLVKQGDPGIFTYGFNQGDLRATDLKLFPFGSYFTPIFKGQKLGEINLKVPGKHNIANSLAAIAVAMFTGISYTEISENIKEYNGTRRRFEKKGLIGNILIVDDYAHHPTEIKATLLAASNTGYKRVITVFQPHRYTRTKHLMDEFCQSFDLVDHLIITDIYSAGEREIEGVSSAVMARKIAKNRDIQVDYIGRLEDIVVYLEKIIKPGDLLMTIGAGDVYRVGELLLERMKKCREMA
jgi:UDP-N-acetylmuramate--alanine ligase